MLDSEILTFLYVISIVMCFCFVSINNCCVSVSFVLNECRYPFFIMLGDIFFVSAFPTAPVRTFFVFCAERAGWEDA